MTWIPQIIGHLLSAEALWILAAWYLAWYIVNVCLCAFLLQWTDLLEGLNNLLFIFLFSCPSTVPNTKYIFNMHWFTWNKCVFLSTREITIYIYKTQWNQEFVQWAPQLNVTGALSRKPHNISQFIGIEYIKCKHITIRCNRIY